MTDKEQIIIDGKKQYCKILFHCKHIDDTAAYDMMCEGIEIKPENAPVSDFELMLIENTNSPFGFSLICKRNNKEDVWEYSGFGNSGACSIVTALLKQLARKTQECEELEKKLRDLELKNTTLQNRYQQLDGAITECDRYRKALEEIEEYVKDLKRDICNNCGWHNTDNCNPVGNVCETLGTILDIINKAKGEG